MQTETVPRTAISAILASAMAAVALGLAGPPLAAQDAEPTGEPSPGEIVDQAAPEEWRTIDTDDMLVMELAPDMQGNPRRVIIQLMPDELTTQHGRNIRKLARAHWWDGTAIVRVQDNYVVQWGDPAAEEEEAKPLPADLEEIPESEYVTEEAELAQGRAALEEIRPLARILQRDAYAPYTDFEDGWPLASDLAGHFWPVHCYGMVGVGRGYSPDTGSGAELYTVIGHAPRHLDRNIALAGRVIAGIEHLSSLPRGTGPLGFYETPEERTTILSVRLASELPEEERPAYAYLATTGPSFVRYAEARANRRDPFFIHPAGGVDICNIPVPIRDISEGE
ncbi:MAG: peptidylprolyl isomerase [Blastomonas sp.]